MGCSTGSCCDRRQLRQVNAARSQRVRAGRDRECAWNQRLADVFSAAQSELVKESPNFFRSMSAFAEYLFDNQRCCLRIFGRKRPAMRAKRDQQGLDEIDRRILEMLQVDCKVPLSRLGEQVGLSAPSVVERVRKLENEGFIQGYHARLNARRLGLDVTAFISVWTAHPRVIKAFSERLPAFEDVLECHHVTGDPSLLLKVKTRNTRSLERLISALRSLSGVERTETNVVLSTLVERPGLGSKSLKLLAVPAEDSAESDAEAEDDDSSLTVR